MFESFTFTCFFCLLDLTRKRQRRVPVEPKQKTQRSRVELPEQIDIVSSGERTPVEEPGPAPFWQLLSAGPFTSGWLCVFLGPGHHELNFLRNSR